LHAKKLLRHFSDEVRVAKYDKIVTTFEIFSKCVDSVDPDVGHERLNGIYAKGRNVFCILSHDKANEWQIHLIVASGMATGPGSGRPHTTPSTRGR
jgi:hypothetical protein